MCIKDGTCVCSRSICEEYIHVFYSAFSSDVVSLLNETNCTLSYTDEASSKCPCFKNNFAFQVSVVQTVLAYV